MDKITDVVLGDCPDSLYLKPSRMHFKQNGKPRTWDLMSTHNSVCILMYNKSREVMVFVKQFRPAVYYNCVPHEGNTVDTEKYPGSLGITLELCAGIVDKDMSLAEIAHEEMLEECGYKVPVESIEKVTSYRSGVGESGSHQTLFYAEVTDAMRVGPGGGNAQEGEYIQVVEMTLPEVQKVIFDETVARPGSFLFALMWFFEKKAAKLL